MQEGLGTCLCSATRDETPENLKFRVSDEERVSAGILKAELSRTPLMVFNGNTVRVHDSPKNDTPDSNSMQKQRTFYSAEVQHAGVSHHQDEDPQVISQFQFKAH